MKSVKQLIEEANKIVIKLGSNTISGADGKVNRELMRDIIGQVCSMIRKANGLFSSPRAQESAAFPLSINGAAKGISIISRRSAPSVRLS